jgi:hypothetical protein
MIPPLDARTRVGLSRWFLPLVAVLLVVGAAGAWGTYAAHVDPGTHVEQRTVSTWERSAYFDYRGLVGVENPVYPVGTVLAGQTQFIRSIVTDFGGEFVYRYRTDDPGSLTVAVESTLVYRAADARTETEFWRIAEPLAVDEATIGPGEVATSRFALDLQAVGDRLATVEEELGRLPSRTDEEVLVVVRTHATGSVGGEPVNERGEFVLGLSFDQGLLVVDDPRVAAETYRSTAGFLVPNEYGALESVGAPAGLALSVVGLAVLGALRFRGRLAVTDAEREHLAFVAARRAHDDWITRGRLTDEALAGPGAVVDSLEGLVDVAIDTDARVLEDPDRGHFVVRSGGIVFAYVPPADPAADADDPATGSDAEPDVVEEADGPDGTDADAAPGGTVAAAAGADRESEGGPETGPEDPDDDEGAPDPPDSPAPDDGDGGTARPAGGDERSAPEWIRRIADSNRGERAGDGGGSESGGP